MATLYAQSAGNWDAILWNTAANGSGTNATPAAADTLISNNYTVAVNGNYTVTKVTNTGGGTFTLGNGSHLTCTDGTAGVVGDVTDAGAVTFALTGTSESATLTAKVLGGNGANEYGVLVSGDKTFTVNGSVTGGSFAGASATGASGLYISGAATVTISNVGNNAVVGGSGAYAAGIKSAAVSQITITGDVTGGIASYTYGIVTTGSATINITGNVTGGINTAYGINSSDSAIISITGSVTGGNSNGGNGIQASSSATITVTGSVSGSILANSNAMGIYSLGLATIAVTGSVTGGAHAVGYGIMANSSATITVTGALVSSSAEAVYATGSAIISINGTLTASASKPALFSSSVVSKTIVTGPLLSTDKTFTGGEQACGVNPILAARWFIKETVLNSFYYRLRSENIDNNDRAARDLYVGAGGVPLTADVRNGITYGAGAFTGSLAVPPAGAVSLGVPVDNTTGTLTSDATNIAAAVWGTPVADLDTANSIGARLAQAATVPSTGAQIAALGV